MSDLQLRAILMRELAHLTRRDDVRRWITTVVTLFLLVSGSATLALLRICLGTRVGGVDMLGSIAACFVGAPTAVFLLQYLLHELEYQADREVVLRQPELAAPLISWLEAEVEALRHPFVVIPHPFPAAAERIEHLQRLSRSAARRSRFRSLIRPLSAVAAIVLLGGVAVAVRELMNGNVPDVIMDASPASAARDATVAAESVQQAVRSFTTRFAPASSDARLRDVHAQVEGLRLAFGQPRRRSK
jgi:hypothetical protein